MSRLEKLLQDRTVSNSAEKACSKLQTKSQLLEVETVTDSQTKARNFAVLRLVYS